LRSLCCQWYGDGVDNTVEENSSVFPLIRLCRQQGRAGSKTVKNHPSLNWRCQVDLYNGRKTVVVVGCGCDGCKWL